jgi:hypothetical protein
VRSVDHGILSVHFCSNPTQKQEEVTTGHLHTTRTCKLKWFAVFISYFSYPSQWASGVKQSGREADHSPPTNAKAKKTWIYTSTLHTSSSHSA